MHFTRFYVLFILFFLSPCVAMEVNKSQFIDKDIKDLEIEDLNNYLKTIDTDKKICFVDGFSLLHLAAQLGAINQASVIIKSKKYDVNDHDNTKGFTPLLIACSENDAAMVFRLLKYGANPTITSKKGTVPLIKAVQKENAVIISLLLAYGADVNQKDVVTDFTPLHMAIEDENSDMVDLLLCNYASPNLGLEHCFTPLMAAAQMEITSKNKETHCLRIIKALLDAKADPNITYLEDGDTALYIAVFHENVSAVYLLLEAGADANVLNKKSNTPLHRALRNINEAIDELCETKDYNLLSYEGIKQNCDIARLLLLYGAQLSKEQLTYKNIDIDLILGAGINTGTNELVKFALEAGANPNYKNVFGDTPLHIIARGVSKESQSAVIVSLLLQHGADIKCVNNNKLTVSDVLLNNQYKKVSALNMINTSFECMKTESNKHNRK